MTEPFNRERSLPSYLILFGLVLIILTFSFGIIGALQYVFPGLLRQSLSFEYTRPLHVSSAVFWIIMCASGAVLTYMQEYSKKGLYSIKLLKWQVFLFIGTVCLILISYLMGIFGGREYWEFHPVLGIPLALGWTFFLINILASIRTLHRQPVFIWMWATGVIFFLFTYGESYLWLFPSIRENVVKDMLIQWKSYGSMVGSWNMLIYGCSIYLMDKISGTDTYSRSKIAFALYFLGLFNLMFNWGHHIYTLPGPKYVQYISYAVSMTELILLGRIILLWKSSLSTARKHYNILPFRFLWAADIWILLTLLLAIGMSIPAINIYTHGTHITVAHTMGATIGINSFLLLAFAFDIFNKQEERQMKTVTVGFYLTLISLFIFWVSLIIAGVLKARWQMSTDQLPFSVMMAGLRPWFVVFLISGISLSTGLFLIVLPLLRYSSRNIKSATVGN
ncbi:MAG TPA: cbb3-type cytochrome c oxidase subunit I [Saprospiraceae bacterium]|nr:cbb3-type cytochrome c oxidase subunit I [Saprospiraceae bacterium]HQW56389.1 cbb3-type cytochrome c oxidase subunit I [Saprospiraceae bacterium]